MKTCLLDARTVAIVRDLRVEKRQGVNGEFESKDILVRIAVDRDYKVTRTENGKTISEYPTDFWLAKFTGNVAQIFADHCANTKEDGKLVSRHLLLNGNFESYKGVRKVTKQININNQLYNVEFDVEVDNTIFIVDSMKFLDKNPSSSSQTNTSGVVTVTPVDSAQVATPVTPVTPVAPVAPATQPVAVATQPVQVSAPAVADMSVAMNPPVVDPNFVPAGTTAPF